jgi:iron(III) transport system substrate-binding protein
VKRRGSVLLLLLAAALLTGCGAQAGRSALAYAPPEEQRVVIYTSHKEEVYGPIIKEFEERTGLWAEVVTGGTNELLERIAAESDAPRCDVIFGGGVESLAAYEDYFQPYACPEAVLLRDGMRPEGDPWTPFSSLPIVLIYNTKLVPPQTITGWSDLLDPRWRGKIAVADPTVSGSSYTGILTMLTALPDDDWELLEQLTENLDGKILPDSGDVVGAVASGSCYVGVTLEETALKRQAQGTDIEIVYPAEGTSAVPDGCALIAGAPHADNAEAFLDFAQSRDVQERLSQFSRRSVRADVEDDPALPPVDELELVDYPVYWAAGLKNEFADRWHKLIGEETS